VHNNNNSSHARGMDGSNETAVVVGSRLATDTMSGSLVNEHWITPLASEMPNEYKTYWGRTGGEVL
jgi:predicted HAD superfamily phosphohydrolase YqeG